MSKPVDIDGKDFMLDGGAGANSGLIQSPYTGQAAGGAGLINSSSIEQQLDLKYKAYSSMPGAGLNVKAPTPTGMLPNTSQYLYSNSNLRTSLDKPLSADGALSVSDLPMSGQPQQQQQQQFLNMNASLGSQQNQNLGPTQIFYQGVPSMSQHQGPGQQSTNQLSFNGAGNAGLPSSQTGLGGANQNMLQQNALVQLMAQQQQQQQQQTTQGNQQNIFGNNATQLLLLELLRQNNLQQQLTTIGQGPGTAANAGSAEATNPANQSMYGTGFATATQLLAQSQQSNNAGELGATQTTSTKDTPSSTNQMLAGLQQPQPQSQPPQPQNLRMNSRDNQATDTSYSQNLQQIYANLNNYQSMIDNLESGTPVPASRQNQTQYDALNQSKYTAQPMQQPQQPLQSNSIEILHQTSVSKAPQVTQGMASSGSALSFTPQQQPCAPSNYDREIDFDQPQQFLQRDQSPPGGRGTSPYSRGGKASAGYDPVGQMTSNELTVSQHRLGAGLGSSQYMAANSERDQVMSTTHQRSRGIRDYDMIGSRPQNDFILEQRGESGERSNSGDRNDISRGDHDQREEDEQIMWPSAMSSNNAAPRKQDHTSSGLLNHQKSTSQDITRQNFMSNQEQSVSGIEWTTKPRQGAGRRQAHQTSAEEGEDSSNFNVNNEYPYREDHSSGFERDLHNQRSNEAINRNIWKRNSERSGLDIDEIPIPTSGEGPKTFEQLLAEKMEAEAALGSAPVEQKVQEPAPKREFLKRKKPTYVPPPKPPTKQYKYYSDAITKSKDGSQTGEEIQAENGRSSRRNIVQTSDEQRNERRRVRTPNAVTQTASGRQNSENVMRNDFMPNQVEMETGPRQRNSSAAAHNQSQTPTNSGQARPFLKRGTGTAHLQGRLRSANPGSQNNLHKQSTIQNQQPQEMKPPTPKIDKSNHLNDNKGRENNHQIGRFGQNNQLDDFQKLEQDCNDHGPVSSSKQKPRQQRKKKLFDSDSEGDDVDRQQQQLGQILPNDPFGGPSLTNHTQQSPSHGESRSNLVKKMFYKEQQQSAVTMSKKKQNNMMMEEDEAQPYMNAQMEALLQKRQDQLEKAIQRYNADNEALARQKAQYENLLRKVKSEQRDLDAQKKNAQADVDKMKEEEMVKLRKEKRAFEQRQKNFQMVSNNSKKEREEIDQLRREYNKYKADSELKAKKAQSQIERLTKQNNELKQKNKEMQEDLRAMEQQRIILERGGPSTVGNGLNQSTNAQTAVNRSTNAQQQSRYTFQQKRSGSGTNQSRAQGNQQNQQQNQEMRNQMLFQDEDDDDQEVDDMDQDAGAAHNNFGVDDNQMQDRNQKRQSYADDGDTDEEELQAEEADQVFDDFAGGPMSGMNRGAAGNTHLDEEHDNEVEEQVDLQVKNGSKGANQGGHSDEEEDFSLKFPKEYHSKTLQNQKVVEQYVGHDGKIQRIYQNGKKEVIFNNGVKRESFPDGYTIVYFNNQDIKQTFPDGKVVYYFAEAQTTQTTFPDKLQVFKFSNNQIEKHFPDKTKEIIFPDGTIKCIFEDGEEESIFPDGTIQKIEKSGVKAIEFANGQKDILYPDGIRVREFPDGKVRKTYPDGRTEVF